MIAWTCVLAWPLMLAQINVPALTGDAGLYALVGNGGVTAGFDMHGRLISYKWPSPGYFDHLHYLVEPDGARRTDQGAMWAVEIDGRLQWLAESPELEAQWHLGEPGVARVDLLDTERAITYRIESFAAPDALAIRLLVSGVANPPRVFWYGNFAPCTRIAKQLPISDWLLDPWNDFGAFAIDNGSAMIHFRPQKPSQQEWDRARRMLRENRSSGEWSVFPDGVYIAYGAAQNVAAFQCGHEATPSSAFDAIAAGRLHALPSAIGHCDSAIEIVPDTSDTKYTATVFLAAATNAAQAMALLANARDVGVDNLRKDSASAQNLMLDQATLPESLPPDIRGRCREAIATILMCIDRHTGAIIRSPSTQPPLALNWARCAAWINLALDAVNLQPLASANLAFNVATVYGSDGTALPGSMPAAVYCDGSPAFPGYVQDLDNTGWLLWSAYQHYRLQSPENAKAELVAWWPKLAAAADFLASWADPRDGAPLHSFDWKTFHDAQRPRNALVAFLGLDAACRLAVTAGDNVPPLWLRRRNELDVWIQLRQLHGSDHWARDDEMVFWLTEQVRRPWNAPELDPVTGTARQMLDPDAPRWANAAAALLTSSPTPEALRDAAWLGHRALVPAVSADTLRTYARPFVDAMDAANYLLAALALAGDLPAAEPNLQSAID